MSCNQTFGFVAAHTIDGHRCCLNACAGLLLAFAAVAHVNPVNADILRRPKDKVPPIPEPIPGTEGITPEPGVQLDQLDLSCAILGGMDLTGANFHASNLTSAILAGSNLTDTDFTDTILDLATLSGATLTNANLSNAVLNRAWLPEATLMNANLANADLTGAFLSEAVFTNANLTDAIVNRAIMLKATGLTQQQLYSTASYRDKNLEGLNIGAIDLSGWDFGDQLLMNVGFAGATLAGADFTNAVVSGTGRFVPGTRFNNTTDGGFTKEQLYSTISYQAKNLAFIDLSENDLTNWDFIDQDLSSAVMHSSMLVDTNFAGAIVNGTNFSGTTSRGFTKQQLYATASYQAKNLSGINLSSNDLTGWNLNNQDLSDAWLSNSVLTDVDLTGAIVNGARLAGAPANGLTEAQFYSTASYQEGDLSRISLESTPDLMTDLTGWNFASQNLTGAFLRGTKLENANLSKANLTSAMLGNARLANADLREANLTDASLRGARLTDADLTDAIITGANFDQTLGTLSKEQFESTANFKAKNLRGVNMSRVDSIGEWDFTGQDITGAKFEASVPRGFSTDHLYSTASYQAKNLQGVSFKANTISGWDFSGQNLRATNWGLATMIGIDFSGADLTGVRIGEAIDATDANFIGANLKSAKLTGGTFTSIKGVETAMFDATTVYDQYTTFPAGFDPVARGLTLEMTADGDFNVDGVLDDNDVNVYGLLFTRLPDLPPFLPPNVTFQQSGDLTLGPSLDVNGDSMFDLEDHRFWVKELKKTWFGDANLDGEFNSGDLVLVAEAGEYRDDVADNSGWAEGDWNADRDFTSADLVIAFIDGGYDQGPRIAVNAVPEPSSLAMLFAGLIGIMIRRRLVGP